MTHTYQWANVYELPYADDSVDTIITDPPWHYETRIPNSKAVNASNFELIKDDEWRGGDTTLAMTASGAQVVKRPTPLTEMWRVLKPGGHLYVFCPERKLSVALERFTSPLGVNATDTYKFDDHFLHFNTIIWVKVRQDGQDLRIGLGHTYRNAFEAVLCFSKGFRRRLEKKNVPNVLFAAPIGGSIKPAPLYATLARASTPPGGVIIDPFAGTDPLSKAGLDEYETFSSDIKEFKHF